ncbi:uncharacterized protein TNCT_474281 [Trichonephila clavata]|uniref:Transposase n=1 Tax=Trichonephila clavata TaxID=2740835 RepID=A0A8X6EY07_TRICU|nr:uncharacterized protein TNCT_474281 [Trichonephila clavata]
MGPYIFKNIASQAVNATGARYRGIIKQFFLPKLDGIDVDMWFQQGGAICRRAHETTQSLCETFPGRIFSRFGNKNWLFRSCDSTLLDFFFMGLFEVKDLCQQTRALQEEIKLCINEIQPQLCRWVMKNFNKKVRMK